MTDPSQKSWLKRRLLVIAAMIVLSLVTGYAAAFRLRLDPNVSALLPSSGEAAALKDYLHAFGGSDLTLVLITPAVDKSGDAKDRLMDEIQEAAKELSVALEQQPTVRTAAWRMDIRGGLDPLDAWRHAGPKARVRLAEALSSDVMRKRLETSRSMLLAPGAGAVAKEIAADPLRLRQLLAESRGPRGGFKTQADGSFANDTGLARLVLVYPAGEALRGADARAFVTEAQRVLEQHRIKHPDLAYGLTGGHAIAAATETMLKRDMKWSSALSLGMAAIAFLLTFRRARALLAIAPPLALGTLWTAGVATLLPGGLSAIAVAFMSVVLGVGVDTGVHVYAALLEGRRAGLSPQEAAEHARRETAKPVLVAATTAAAAFFALMLSDIGALRQLGFLCGSGEALTAVAILLVTPRLGAFLERGDPPAHRPPIWADWIHALIRTRPRALIALAICVSPVVLFALGFQPKPGAALVALRPKGLAPLEVQEQIYSAFGGRSGQWVVMVEGDSHETAMRRADLIVEALEQVADDLESVDSLTPIVPARATQKLRFEQRDGLLWPVVAERLEAALIATGFSAAPFADLLKRWQAPRRTYVDLDQMQSSDNRIMLSRYLGSVDDRKMAVIYVQPKVGGNHAGLVEATILRADPKAAITGYGRLETALRDSLVHDLPRVGAVALLLVIVVVGASLRKPRDIALAITVIVAELSLVLVLIRAFDVPLHVYDALVLPVLLGITVDEGMFLLFRARKEQAEDPEGGLKILETLRHEGPPVATTALTTAAGFAGLIICRFDGLRHLGSVGALGSLAGLLVALIVVPAGLVALPGKTHTPPLKRA